MNSNPEISVICCNFNHATYIEEAVTSILGQTFKDLELIIVDDCSTDHSKQTIEDIVKNNKNDSRIQTPIYLEQNRGKWFALNTGISTARGKLITLQDADDCSCLQRLERQRDVLKSLGSYHNLCGFTHCFSQHDMERAKTWTTENSSPLVLGHKEVTEVVHKGFTTPGINHYYAGSDYEIHGASTLFYKQLWTYGMRFNAPLIGTRITNSEDSDHNCRMTLLLQKTSFLKEPLYCYRRGTSTNNELK